MISSTLRFVVVTADSLRRELSGLLPSRAAVVAEGGGWSAVLPGVPVHGDAETRRRGDVPIDDLVEALRECAEEQEFWECVSNGNPPKRGFGAGETPATALHAQLVHQLIHDLGVPEGEIVGMTLERATQLMIAYWSQPRD